MSTAQAHAGARGGFAWRLIKELIKRVYAIVIILLVAWLSYMAFRYLIVSLVVPAEAPPQIKQLPLRLDAGVLRAPPEQWTGVTATRRPRLPLAHYHDITGWFQPDLVNDCTRSGCHVPIAHDRHKEVRAFLNMHATSMHCSVCHLQTDKQPLPLVWYDLRDGDMTDPPALLQAMALLLSEEGRQRMAAPTAAFQEELVHLLEQAAQQAGNDPALARLAESVAGPRFSSPMFTEVVRHVKDRLPLHYRGEYGAKLALRGDDGQPLLSHPGTAAEVQRFLREKDQMAPDTRAALLDKIHPLRRSPTLQCTACHQAAGSLVDLAAVGYPAQRVAELQQGWVFTAIEHIMAGESFQMPGFVGPDAAPDNSPHDEGTP